MVSEYAQLMQQGRQGNPESFCGMALQDPHFKAGTHRRRIISRAQLADYAYLLAPGGILYTITDVPELSQWMREKVHVLACHKSYCSASLPL